MPDIELTPTQVSEQATPPIYTAGLRISMAANSLMDRVVDAVPDRARNALALGSSVVAGAAGFVGGLVMGQETVAADTKTPTAETSSRHFINRDQLESKIQKIAKICSRHVVVNPNSPMKVSHHRKNKAIGKLDVDGEDVYTYKFTPKKGVKTCPEALGQTASGKLFLVKLVKNKYVEKDPHREDPTSAFVVYAEPPVKKASK